MRRMLKASALLAAVALGAATGAGAAVSPSYQVAGIETGAPQSNTSPFAGLAVGSAGDRAFWQASVVHDPLAGCATVGSSCAITGGTFSLRSNAGTLTGTFSGGSVQLSSQQPGCGRQQFAVNGNLTTATGAMSFTGTLVHYRLLFRGQCTVFAATVQGSLAPAAAATPPPSGGDGSGGGTL
jgi:hypothetical protein